MISRPIFCRCGRPCFISKRRASLDAAADSHEFRFSLTRIHMRHPVSISSQWPWRQNFFPCLAREPAIQTTPTPVFRPLHQHRTKCIAFDVSAHRQKVVIVLHPPGKHAAFMITRLLHVNAAAVNETTLALRHRHTSVRSIFPIRFFGTFQLVNWPLPERRTVIYTPRPYSFRMLF